MSPLQDQERPQEMPQDVSQGPEQSMPPGAPGAGEEQALGELAKKAQVMIYQDKATYDSLLQMLESHKGKLSQGIATAALTIIRRLEDENGQMNTNDLQQVGIVVVTALYDLAVKSGIAQQPSEEEATEAYGLAIQMWMKQNPDRADPELFARGVQEQQAGQVGQPTSAPPSSQQPAASTGLLQGGM